MSDVRRVELETSLQPARRIFTMMALGAHWEQRTRISIPFVIGVALLSYATAGELIFLALWTRDRGTDLDTVAEILSCMITNIIALSKIYGLISMRLSFAGLLDRLIELWPQRPLCHEARHIKEFHLSRARRVSTGFCWVVWLGTWYYLLTPLVTTVLGSITGPAPTLLRLPLVVWYPFDAYQHPIYELIYATHVIVTLTAILSVLAADIVLVAIASHCSWMLELLAWQLQLNPRARDSKPPQYSNLVAAVRTHQTIIGVFDSLQHAYSLGLFINLTLSSVLICFTGFYALLVEDWTSLRFKLFLVPAMLEVGVVCWCGDWLQHASASVSVAAASGAWVGAGSRYGRALTFLIARAQKPLRLRAAGLADASLATFGTILSSSYSYFTLLRSAYQPTNQ